MIKHLTQSMLKDYLSCPKKFYYSYIKLIKPRAYHFPFSIGAAVDGGIEHYYRYKDVKGSIRTATQILYDRKTEFENYGSFSMKEEQEFQYQLTCSEGILQAYPVYNKKFIDDTIAINMQFMATHTVSGVPIPIAGKVDGIIKRKNKVHLYELKTTKRIDMKYMRQYFSQLYMYYMLLTEGSGLEIDSYVYLDLIEKPSIRQRQNEDNQEFLNRLYDWYLVSGDKFLIHQVRIKNRYLKQFKELLKITAYQILENIEKNQFAHNRFACDVYSGCQFYTLCEYGFNPMTERKFVKKTQLSKELKEV